MVENKKGLNIIAKLTNVMGKRLIVTVIIFLLLSVGTIFLGFGIFNRNNVLMLIFPITFILAFLIGLFKRQIYRMF